MRTKDFLALLAAQSVVVIFIEALRRKRLDRIDDRLDDIVRKTKEMRTAIVRAT